MGKVRVLSNRTFDITILETGQIIPNGISLMEEEDAIANSRIIRILNRIEEPINETDDKTDDINIENTELSSVPPITDGMKDTNTGSAYKF